MKAVRSISVTDSEEATAAAMKMKRNTTGGQLSEVELATCECCGLMEECTPGYIGSVRERFEGRWICGLCAEAVKDEARRSNREDLMPIHEALNRHMKFCQQFKSSSPPTRPTQDLISAMKLLVRRSLDSPRRNGSSPPAAFTDPSKACLSSLSN